MFLIASLNALKMLKIPIFVIIIMFAIRSCNRNLGGGMKPNHKYMKNVDPCMPIYIMRGAVVVMTV